MARYFNGSNADGFFNNSRVNSLNEHSVSFWLRRLSRGDANSVFLLTGTINTGISIFQSGNSETFLQRYVITAVQKNNSVTNGLVDDQWMHYVASYDATDMKIFINGILRSTLNAPGTMGVSSGSNSTIGGSAAAFSLDGSLAEMGIWDVALTEGEIKALAEGYTCDTIRPQSLIEYYPLLAEQTDFEPSGIINGTEMTLRNASQSFPHPPIIRPTRKDRYLLLNEVVAPSANTFTQAVIIG